VEWLLLVPIFVALLLLFGPSRYDAGGAWRSGESDPPDDRPPRTGGVREPRRPPPGTDMAAVALEPWEEA
jgi:hypothetical protein